MGYLSGRVKVKIEIARFSAVRERWFLEESGCEMQTEIQHLL